MWSVPQETAAGLEIATPGLPSVSQLLQAVPFHEACQMALSVPRTNTSSRFAPHDETAGEEPAAIPGGGGALAASRGSS